MESKKQRKQGHRRNQPGGSVRDADVIATADRLAGHGLHRHATFLH